MRSLADAGRDADGAVVVDKVVGIEARGFILAAPVALALGAGFVPVRKAGKLPGPTHAVSYALEYGEATLEVHQDAFDDGERVLIVDDVLATGGTAAATRKLVEQCGCDGDRLRRTDGAVVPPRAGHARATCRCARSRRSERAGPHRLRLEFRAGPDAREEVGDMTEKSVVSDSTDAPAETPVRAPDARAAAAARG